MAERVVALTILSGLRMNGEKKALKNLNMVQNQKNPRMNMIVNSFILCHGLIISAFSREKISISLGKKICPSDFKASTISLAALKITYQVSLLSALPIMDLSQALIIPGVIFEWSFFSGFFPLQALLSAPRINKTWPCQPPA